MRGGLILILLVLLSAGCSSGFSDPDYSALPTETNTARLREITQTKELPTATHTPAPNPTLPVPNETAAIIPWPEPKALYQITFISARSEFEGIHGIDVYCLDHVENCLGEPKLLLTRREKIESYDWSPDGKRIALIVEGKLHIADWNGKNLNQITDHCGRAE
jgi:hypothetical protein